MPQATQNYNNYQNNNDYGNYNNCNKNYLPSWTNILIGNLHQLS